MCIGKAWVHTHMTEVFILSVHEFCTSVCVSVSWNPNVWHSRSMCETAGLLQSGVFTSTDWFSLTPTQKWCATFDKEPSQNPISISKATHLMCVLARPEYIQRMCKVDVECRAQVYASQIEL